MATSNSFYEQVYQLVKLIPEGRVTTYGEIAKVLASPQSSRLVGYAMSKALDYDPAIPAHRVVNRKGLLTGAKHFAHPNTMQELLESEGLSIKNHQIQDFDKYFYNLYKELI